MIGTKQSNAQPPVDLVINCYERTYREVLAPGFFPEIERSCCFRFSQRVALINNVNNLAEARHMALKLRGAGEIDEFVFVEELIASALKKLGLSQKALDPLPFYSNWALVALILPGSDYMVHWDAEVRLTDSIDWISPSLQLMRENRRIATTNPLWKNGEDAPEFRERAGEFSFSYGFSDQLYLLDRREFARPIYHYWVPISCRFPVSHIAPYFEQWVDSYIRVTKRYRATFMKAHYVHTTEEGAAYPRNFESRLRFLRNRIFVKVIRSVPGNHRYFHD